MEDMDTKPTMLNLKPREDYDFKAIFCRDMNEFNDEEEQFDIVAEVGQEETRVTVSDDMSDKTISVVQITGKACYEIIAEVGRKKRISMDEFFYLVMKHLEVCRDADVLVDSEVDDTWQKINEK